LDLENIKKIIEAEMNGREGKIVFSKKIGKRNEYVFSVGETLFGDNEVIFEDEKYIIFAEEVENSVKEKIKKNLFKKIKE